jgi:hypothetical protein
MNFTDSIGFWLPTSLAIFSTFSTFYEMNLRRKSDAKTSETLLKILDRLTKIAERSRSKKKSSNIGNPSMNYPSRQTNPEVSKIQELEIKKRKIELQEKKFTWQKLKDIRDTIGDYLDYLESED